MLDSQFSIALCENSTMPDSPLDRRNAARKPLPHCKAFLICEEVGIDELTGRFNLYRLLNSLRFLDFPAQIPPLAMFLQLYDGIGQYGLSVELRNLSDDTSVTAEIFSDVEFPERLVNMELVVPIDLMRLPHSGRYEIAILLDGQELATQFIDAEVANDEETE